MANISRASQARTKIIATVGPACRESDQLAALVDAGADVFRLNMAHGSREEHSQTLSKIRRLSDERGQPLAVLIDLAGPKIRLRELAGGMIDCVAGAEFRFVRGDQMSGADELATTYEPLVDELQVGDMVMLADGTVS